ncbi:MAG TPA: HEAT repeat domain-containing protein, partial [Candidatus Wallbacteria bacterium]|nr:HEAT repeat domain-containing protein [Candidatus Wallbacteria bacterium]
DGEVRGEAALSFIDLEDRRAIRPLITLGLVDAANVVRLNSAYALSTFDSSAGEGVLVWFLWEQNLASYRQRAVSGLANIRSRSVIQHLQRALSDWDDIVRDTAFYALRNKWGYNITQ